MKELIEEIKRLQPLIEKMDKLEITRENLKDCVRVLVQANDCMDKLKKYLDDKQ